MPLDLLVYRADSLELPAGFRIQEGDAYFEGIRQQWCAGLRELLRMVESKEISEQRSACCSGVR